MTDLHFFISPTMPLMANFSEGLGSVWHFLASGGVFMGLIVACSVMAVTVIVAKFSELRESRVMPAGTVDVLVRLASGRDVSDAQIQQVLQQDASPLGVTARAALLVPHRSKEEAMSSAQTVAREEIIRLERGVPLLESIIAAGPLLGLLGAVVGLTRVFKARSQDWSWPFRVCFSTVTFRAALNIWRRAWKSLLNRRFQPVSPPRSIPRRRSERSFSHVILRQKTPDPGHPHRRTGGHPHGLADLFCGHYHVQKRKSQRLAEDCLAPSWFPDTQR
jgi:biopolymer transport protein ExbB/TolQ